MYIRGKQNLPNTITHIDMVSYPNAFFAVQVYNPVSSRSAGLSSIRESLPRDVFCTITVCLKGEYYNYYVFKRDNHNCVPLLEIILVVCLQRRL